MNKKLLMLLFGAFLLTGCSGIVDFGKTDDISSVTDDEGKISKPLDMDTGILSRPDTKYDPSVLLLKTSETFGSDVLPKDMSDLGIESISDIGKGSDWKKATLQPGYEASASISSFRKSNLFEMVDFDYIYETGDTGTSEVTSSIPTEIADYQKQVGIDKAWEWMEENGHTAGGDSSVVVAVIDTGVDYNHPDLKQNMWINKGEIPNNGIDDDGNGYVDDFYGWDFVGDDNDPMDDNGHGTHVAGIIGAADNGIGVTGVAYNCKIMPIKAGNSSGYFNNSDIASAITYAYMNGADVINMSFGGSSVTMAVQEALERAYSTSFLVAAAGNDTCPNEKRIGFIPEYPAAYPFVDGVMSVGKNNAISVFSNYDVVANSNVEYECFAPGEGIQSTFPNSKYATLSGTSMAAPVVSGIAALLRSCVPDKSEYPSKFLMSQINETSESTPVDHFIPGHWNKKAMVVDAYRALTASPKPDVSLYDWYTFDTKSISSKNNGDDNIDAGETIHIGVELMNRGGMAKDVTATIDVNRNGTSDIVDPYVEITQSIVKFSDIGTYSVRDAGQKTESSTIVDVENPFVLKVAENVPNNYQCDINIHITWKDGMDSSDDKTYSADDVMSVTFHRGEALPARIDSDMTLTKDKLWIVNDTVRIGEGVTVTVEPGTKIQFYEQNQSKYQYASPKIVLADKSSFICNGTEDEMIEIYPAEGFEDYVVIFEKTENSDITANVNLMFVKIENLYCLDENNGGASFIGNKCYITLNSDSYNHYYQIKNGISEQVYYLYLSFNSLKNTVFKNLYIGGYFDDSAIINSRVIESSLMISNTKTSVFSQKIRQTTFISVANNLSDNTNYSSAFLINIDGTFDGTSSIFEENALIHNCTNDDKLIFYSLVASSIGNITISNNTFYGYPLPMINHAIQIDNAENVMTGTGSIAENWPFISGYQFLNDKGEETTTFSDENMTLKLSFNRPMDTSDPLSVSFGSVYPYSDYVIEGDWQDESTWVGKRKVPTAIENGEQHLNVIGGRAKDDHFLTNGDNGYRISFNIDTTGAMAMNMSATATKDGIQLEMNQDDYPTVMGYNVYRSEEASGEYTKINTAVIMPEEGDDQKARYLDTTVEPGKAYYYSYTAVMTDFSESPASGRTACVALDTILPVISHTPVSRGYLSSNININCVIRDNVRVDYARLYYRTKGESEYKCVEMNKANDSYCGVISANTLTLTGMEYYIETSDGTNVVTLGTKENPYSIIVSESSDVSYLGDVDGNGLIEAADAMLVLQHINGKRVLVNDSFRRADLDGNGVLESFEALAILQYVNGNRTTLEV